jgi:hypothetical protein
LPLCVLLKSLCHRDVIVMPFDQFGCWVFSRRDITDNNKSLRNMGFSQWFRAYLATW